MGTCINSNLIKIPEFQLTSIINFNLIFILKKTLDLLILVIYNDTNDFLKTSTILKNQYNFWLFQS